MNYDLQPHDEHHAERYSVNIADNEHGQILERSACHLRYAQAG